MTHVDAKPQLDPARPRDDGGRCFFTDTINGRHTGEGRYPLCNYSNLKDNTSWHLWCQLDPARPRDDEGRCFLYCVPNKKHTGLLSGVFLPNLYTVFGGDIHFVFIRNAKCIIPCVDVWQYSIYAPPTQRMFVRFG